jgi:hypothetical protein
MSKDKEERFPQPLLKKSTLERSKYFREYTVGHPVLKNAYEKAMRILRQPSGKQIVLVVGPGRSGKTFLNGWLAEDLKSDWAPHQASDPGRIPVVSIEVPARDTLRPSWTLIYELILRALEEPLIDKKIVYGGLTLHPTGDGNIKLDDRIAGGKLGMAARYALQYRRPVVFFDEFHHLLNWPGLSFQDQMDCVKSLSNQGKTKFSSQGETKLGLFATYEVLDPLDLSDQVICRTKIIHLHRYGDSEEDQANFEGVIYSFQINMPFGDEPDLLRHFDYLYERTNGRVGLLAIWLQEAFDMALEEGASTVKLKHLKATEPLTKTQALKMHNKLVENENRYNELVGEDSEIGNEEDEDLKANAKSHAQSDESITTNKKQGRGKTGKVGERRPGRDVTGRDKVAA